MARCGGRPGCLEFRRFPDRVSHCRDRGHGAPFPAAGLATRRHVAAPEPVGDAVIEQATATSRSAVSRRFVA